ncbi:tartronate semialdehyde reductase [Caballeronia catudaia]|uniref:Tartronate semialdehyde reductase n=1 Tax=Caballeronia catudaia TaxID=1777136 RepID=A0A158D429_9BURK|nr:tartronate semialdehyde reductase [Caballeronia catudaia]
MVNVISQRLENRMQKAGFIGLGIMGTPMAANLRKGGVELVAFTQGFRQQVCGRSAYSRRAKGSFRGELPFKRPLTALANVA